MPLGLPCPLSAPKCRLPWNLAFRSPHRPASGQLALGGGVGCSPPPPPPPRPITLPLPGMEGAGSSASLISGQSRVHHSLW